MWVHVQVRLARLYWDDKVEIEGYRLSDVSGGPIGSVWLTIDATDLPTALVGTADTWRPPHATGRTC
ncbi:hypothetical protein D0Q02_07705 [Micromonospora craniellae]|uniref:Uncharacterized protein n=2 Tax=Micromonospora craniellae TaxID=2294034 RepID=A0A372G1V5_9ACTN|nr:hypothetical protein D0Q02_07705 [Micromonospora craniellae]